MNPWIPLQFSRKWVLLIHQSSFALRIICFVLLFGTGMSACAPVDRAFERAAPETATIGATATHGSHTPTARATHPIPTLQLTDLASSPAEEATPKTTPCEVLTEKPFDEELTGRLVFQPRLTPPYFLDLSTQKKTNIVDEADL